MLDAGCTVMEHGRVPNVTEEVVAFMVQIQMIPAVADSHMTL